MVVYGESEHRMHGYGAESGFAPPAPAPLLEDLGWILSEKSTCWQLWIASDGASLHALTWCTADDESMSTSEEVSALVVDTETHLALLFPAHRPP